MIHFSLFSGIGGFEIAAEAMGWKNLVSCDINEFGNRVREYYWPEGYHHKNIKTLNYDTIQNELSKRHGSEWRNEDIILTGGFPCQPFSAAGKRLGTEDDRHLWPEMLRVIGEIQPRWVLGENVRGLTNWNGGMVFDQVQADLENEGYEILPFVLPACAVGAPHRRDRIWFVAHAIGRTARSSGTRGRTDSNGSAINPQPKEWRGEAELNTGCGTILRDATDTRCNNKRCKGESEWTSNNITRCCKENNASNTEGSSIEGQLQQRQGKGELGRSNSENVSANTDGKLQQRRSNKERSIEAIRYLSSSLCRNIWKNFPTQSPICGGDDGLPTKLDGITFSKWRNESIKAYGNAVVPALVLQIFKAIEAYELLNKENQTP